jgi:hypothetical protein
MRAAHACAKKKDVDTWSANFRSSRPCEDFAAALQIVKKK